MNISSLENSKEKGLVWALLENSCDSDIDVQRSVSSSLITLGQQHPLLVLSYANCFLCNPQTAPNAHIQSIIYNAVESILKENEEKIHDQNIVEVWAEESKELLIRPSVALELQQAASSLLVTLGTSNSYTSLVMSKLISAIKCDCVPIVSVVDTLSSMAFSSSRNTAPYFLEILNKLVPAMGRIKQENIRVAVSVLLAKFSEALIDALMNNPPYLQVTIEDHFDPCGDAYEILLNNWMKSSNISVKNDILESLGYLSSLISSEKICEVCTPTIHAILNLYKKNTNPYVVTSTLALFFNSLFNRNISDSLKQHSESILATLFNQACTIPNYNEPVTVKNHCEVLRCYEILAKNFPEHVVNQLLQRLENASHVHRVGSLVVLKHLINTHSIDANFMKKIELSLLSVLSDPNSKVVRSVTLLIVTLCYADQLSEKHGSQFVAYLVQHSAGGSMYPLHRTPTNELGEEQIGDMCCRALNLLATTITSAVPILWPYLLHYINNTDFSDSLPAVLSCLAHLSTLPQTQADESRESIFQVLPPTVSEASLITRLLLLACIPFKSVDGVYALTLINGLSSHISNSLVNVWNENLPQLKANYSEACKTSTEPAYLQLWQDSLRDFLSCTLATMNSETFSRNLITAQLEQLEQNHRNQPYRCFLMSLIGVTLKFCLNSSLIDNTLESIYSSTNHKSSAEQENFSIAVGICASAHMDLTLSKIESWLKTIESSKKSLSLLSILKQDTRAEEYSLVRSSIVHSLGQIATLSPPELIGSKIDGPIMLHLLNIINSNKNEFLNEVIMQTTSKVAKALAILPSFILRQRPIFITHIVNSLKQENVSLTAICSCLQALRDLVALEPQLNVEERSIILQASLSITAAKFCNASVIDSNLAKCYSQLNVLIRTIIQRDTNPATLDDITTLLHSWTLSSVELVRLKAMDLMYSTFCTYLQYLVLDHTNPSSFNQTSQLLSILTPRIADSPEISVSAVSCMSLVLKIAGRYAGLSNDYSDKYLQMIKKLEMSVSTASNTEMHQHFKDIAKIICNKLTFVQLRLYLNLMVSGLQDNCEGCSSGVAKVLSEICCLKGHQMHQHIKEILDSIFNRLEKVSNVSTRYHSFEAICNLSRHNLSLVADVLLSYPIPFESGICETLQRIGRDSDLSTQLLTHFTQILERTHPFTEQKTATDDIVKIATLPTISVICAMKESLIGLEKPLSECEKNIDCAEDSVIETRKIINERFSSLFALLLLCYGSYIDVIAPLHQSSTGSKQGFIPNRGATALVPSKCVLECLQAYVSAAGYSLMNDSLSIELQLSKNESFDNFLNTVAYIIQLLVQEGPQQLSSLVAYLDTHHAYEMQRVTVTCVFGQLVASKCRGDYELLEIITTGLLTKLNDKASTVRRLAVRGLANFSDYNFDKELEKLSEIFSALVIATELRHNTTESQEDDVPLEALKGLSRIVYCVPKAIIFPQMTSLFQRIRLFMEKKGELREAAVHFLTAISHVAGKSSEFSENIHMHLLSTIIHLEDPHAPVSEACKGALREIGTHLNSVEIEQAFNKHLQTQDTFDYSIFIGEISQHLVDCIGDNLTVFVQASSSYFRHNEPSIRRASVILTGNMIYSAGENIGTAIIQKACLGVSYLMKDVDSQVRSAAVLTVPLFYKYEKYL